MLPLYILRHFPLLCTPWCHPRWLWSFFSFPHVLSSRPCSTPCGTSYVDPRISWKCFTYESPSLNFSLLLLIQTFQPPACSFSSFWVSLAFLPSLYTVTDHFTTMQTSFICPLTFCILPWQGTDFGQVKPSIFSALILQLLCNHGQTHVPAKLHIHSI